MEQGGTVVTIGGSTSLAYALGLPVKNALVERQGDLERPLPGEKYYVPGSLLAARVRHTAISIPASNPPAACPFS